MPVTRRKILGGMAASALLGKPHRARAQTGDMPVIGFLHSAWPEAFAHLTAAFRQGLEKMGYVEGRNVAIEYRWAAGQYDRLTPMARELVEKRVAIIATAGGEHPAFAAKQATSSIPIVVVMGRDLVAAGMVDSLSRPGGNLTGVMQFTIEMAPIRIGLLHELAPQARSVSLLVNARNPNAAPQIREAEAAARQIGLGLNVLQVDIENDLAAAFAAMDQIAPQALLVGSEPVLLTRRREFVAGVAQRAIPAVYDFREFPEAGGLLSYGASLADTYQQIGIYAGRLLRGAKPADLPIVRSSRFELVVNLGVARAMNLTVPQSILLRADEVIE